MSKMTQLKFWRQQCSLVSLKDGNNFNLECWKRYQWFIIIEATLTWPNITRIYQKLVYPKVRLIFTLKSTQKLRSWNLFKQDYFHCHMNKWTRKNTMVIINLILAEIFFKIIKKWSTLNIKKWVPCWEIVKLQKLVLNSEN